MCFSIFGILIIFIQLISEAKKFSFLNPNTPFNWLKEWLFIKKKTINFEEIKLSLPFHPEDKPPLSSISQKSPIDAKIDFLLSQNEIMYKRVNLIEDKINGKIAKINHNFIEIKSDIESRTNYLENLIGDHIVENISFTIFGIVLTLCGIILQYFFPANITFQHSILEQSVNNTPTPSSTFMATTAVLPTTLPSETALLPPDAGCIPANPQQHARVVNVIDSDFTYCRFRVIGADPHNFDGEGDGIGCERK
jgi:hypothetical protein